MSSIVICIDHEHAKIFELAGDGTTLNEFKLKHVEQHTHRGDEIDKQRLEHQLFDKVTKHLTPQNKILLLGPGLGKDHFLKYLGDKSPLLAKAVVACETVDHPTDPQIIARAKTFFEV